MSEAAARDALMRARDFVTLAVRGMATEDQIGVLQRVFAQLQVAVGSYADPQWADAQGWPAVTGALREVAVSAAPGSDTQLAAVQALAGAKLSSGQLAEIAGWRDGSAPLAGLTVDTDLSWTLLGALVAHGLPAEVVHRVNAELRGKFLARYGVASAAIAVARLLPFGAGAAVGAVAGAASSGAVVRATRKAFDV